MSTIDATLVAQVVDRTIALASIPAPTGEEAARAELVASWWRADGFDEVHGDAAGNVWARARGGAGAAVGLAAHPDTVFGPDVAHEILRGGGTVRRPRVGGGAGGGGGGAAAGAAGPP